MKYKILVADDSNVYLEIIESIFAQLTNNYKLITASDGKEACKKALAHKPDLILMDLVMPKMNGEEAIHFLKNHRETRQIPIIIFTSSESLEKAFRAGADDFIIKPFKNFEILMRIRLALNLVEKIDKIKEQNKKLQLQNLEIEKQRKQLEIQKKDIIDDIRYSKRIQNAILPTTESINSILKEYFIFNKPKNIVSGDFYWIDKINGKQFFAVADCTGHGISGAFMTMAGIAFLKEIINNYSFNSAADILNQLRIMVIKLLQQYGKDGEANDGMDIALCIFDPTEKKLQFAGANRPLYIIKNKQLIQIKSDPMPIGIHHLKSTPFSEQVIKIDEEDIIYMFSDGFPDQFGGKKNKKFGYKKFRELLIEINMKPLETQLKIINKTFDNWKGDFFQVDDVLILGIKL